MCLCVARGADSGVRTLRPNRCERELCRWIDSLIREMNEVYLKDMPEMQRIESMMEDISMRESLVSQISEEIELRKIQERMHMAGKDASYIVEARIGTDGISHRARRRVQG